MDKEKKEQTTDEGAKPQVRDLETKKDVKGGGSLKPKSPVPGGDSTQPIPNQGS